MQRNKHFQKFYQKLRKELGNVYSDRLEWMTQMKKGPVHKKIMESRKRFVEDSFEEEEVPYGTHVTRQTAFFWQ